MFQPCLDFSATPAAITANAERLVKSSRCRRDELVRTIAPEQATFANVMVPLAHMQNDFTIESNVLSFHRHVSEDADIRAASANAQALFDDFHAECWMREDVFKLVDAVYCNSCNLQDESALFLEMVHAIFARSSLGIRNAASRERYKEIQRRLSRIHAEFRENLGCCKDEMFFSVADLEGVPAATIEQLERDASNGKLRLDLSNPSHRHMLVSADRGETRKKLYLASDDRCGANVPLVKEAVRLRHEMAKLLGFENYATFQLQSRMAKTPERVSEFLLDMQSKLRSHGLSALQELKDLKNSDANKDDDSGGFFHCDYDYYHSRLLKSRLSMDRSRIQEYFPLQTTTAAILNLFGQLFGISFDEINPAGNNIWHTDVQMFSVHDNAARGGEFLGYLYLDLFRRDGKYPHESCFSLQPGFTRQDGTRHYPSTALTCAFSKPTPTKPSLLSHFEVTTLLHELGHGIHDLVSKTQYAHFHGPDGVPVDFGELPSQMLEYWCWTPSQLQSLSHHYAHLGPEMRTAWEARNPGRAPPETPQIPNELIEALTRAGRSTFGPLFHLDQVHRASFDLAVHQLGGTDEEVAAVDITVLWNKSRKDIGLIDGQEVFDGKYTHGNGYATTTHLMQNDYAAGYYGYLYSKVYAADLFYSEFQDNPRDTEKFQRYRQCVLESGGSRDGFQSLVDFLGREPSGDAFYNSLLPYVIFARGLAGRRGFQAQTLKKAPGYGLAKVLAGDVFDGLSRQGISPVVRAGAPEDPTGVTGGRDLFSGSVLDSQKSGMTALSPKGPPTTACTLHPGRGDKGLGHRTNVLDCLAVWCRAGADISEAKVFLEDAGAFVGHADGKTCVAANGP
ncbi:hypothetical protein LLEC1_04745 [Akanthomyces lecanii]|uniref:Peptidase M3A/M3B catalytic domain-containing protein n=1 Tax=Cordyceps confragosa TaxID=2714763 RepID=A0A179ICI9_CORDF|nr:hypothetical protein LLEC1_04745 [Akanthomyces lecanii]